jgi:Metal binding domain of Ada
MKGAPERCCRPTCPVKPAKSCNVVVFATAAAAERAGFRSLPALSSEAASGTPAWRGAAATVTRAFGRLSRRGKRVEDLPETRGMTSREQDLPKNSYDCSITVPSARVRDSIQRRPDRDRPAVARARTEDDPSERGIGMTMNRCTDPAAKVLAELRPRPSGPTGRCVSDTQRLEAMGASP